MLAQSYHVLRKDTLDVKPYFPAPGADLVPPRSDLLPSRADFASLPATKSPPEQPPSQHLSSMKQTPLTATPIYPRPSAPVNVYSLPSVSSHLENNMPEISLKSIGRGRTIGEHTCALEEAKIIRVTAIEAEIEVAEGNGTKGSTGKETKNGDTIGEKPRVIAGGTKPAPTPQKYTLGPMCSVMGKQSHVGK